MKCTIAFLFVLLTALISGNGFAANELFRSISNGNWNSTLTWQMSTNGGSTWVAASSTPHDTSGAITIRNPNTVTVTANVTANQLTVDSGGVLAVNAGIILTLVEGSGNEINSSFGSIVNGPGTVKTQGTIIEMNLRGGSLFNAQLNVNSGTTYVYDVNSPYDGRVFGNVTIDAGATINGGSSSGRSLQLYGNVTNNGTLTASSTGGSIRFRGASFTNNGALSPAGSVYFDTTTSVSGIGTFTPASSYISANGNVTLLNSITYSPSSQISIETGGTLNPNGNTFTLTSGTMTVSLNATVSAPGTVSTQGTVALNLRAGSFFNAPLIVNSGTTFAYDQSAPYNGRIFGNVTIDVGATLNCGNISGRSLQLYGSVTNNGTLTASSSGGSIRVRGSSLANNGLINPAGSFFFDTTTALSGTGSFTSGVSLSGNANVTLNSSHQMSAVTVNTGTSFNISNRWLRLSASNPLVVAGTLTATGSTVEYNGVAAQTVSATGITYSRLRINNSSGTTLANNVTVNDSLIIQNGTLDINTRILTISPTGFLSESPGNVVKGSSGYLTTTRSINAPSSLDVGGFGAVLTTSANLGSTEIRRGHAVQTGGSIRRYYDITPANNSGLNATLKFRYDDSELNLRPEKAIKLFKSTNSGATWTNMGGTVNISTNEITITGLTSFSRWTADSTGVSAIISFGIEGYYNASNNRLRMEDTVRIYLRNISPPYSVVDSAVALLDSVLLKAAFIFSNAPSGTYYIQVRHRNALETWSKSGGEQYIAGNTLNYDFLPSAATAFGSNQRQVDASPLRFAFYSGDVTQDGAIDGSDLSIIDNDAINFLSGYIVSDVNGDRFVDATDYSIADNNAANFISVARP